MTKPKRDKEVEGISPVSWATRDVIDEANGMDVKMSIREANEILDRCHTKIEQAQVDSGFAVIREEILRTRK